MDNNKEGEGEGKVKYGSQEMVLRKFLNPELIKVIESKTPRGNIFIIASSTNGLEKIASGIRDYCCRNDFGLTDYHALETIREFFSSFVCDDCRTTKI